MIKKEKVSQPNLDYSDETLTIVDVVEANEAIIIVVEIRQAPLVFQNMLS